MCEYSTSLTNEIQNGSEVIYYSFIILSILCFSVYYFVPKLSSTPDQSAVPPRNESHESSDRNQPENIPKTFSRRILRQHV